jgi:DnaJ-class molecular chaperone
MIKCTKCNGRGEFMGLGMMAQKCPECNGTGLIEEENEVVEVEEIETLEKVPVKLSKSNRSEKMRAAWAKRKSNDKVPAED